MPKLSQRWYRDAELDCHLLATPSAVAIVSYDTPPFYYPTVTFEANGKPPRTVAPPWRTGRLATAKAWCEDTVQEGPA